MENRNVRGKISYRTEKDGNNIEYGQEWFSVTWHADGQRTLRSVCEIESGPIAKRSVTRDVTYTVDREYRPLDCFVRLHQDGKFLGSGWFRFTDSQAECEVFNVTTGRVSQKFDLQRPVPSFGAHALICDITHLAKFDHSSKERIQPAQGVMLSSFEHDGCSGPLLCPLDFKIEYVGREELTVPAGTFETDHYRFLLEGSLPQDHPTEDLWCTPEDFVFVKIAVGGYMNSSFELIEFDTDF